MKLVAARVLDPTHLELEEALSAPAGQSIEIAIPEPATNGGGSRRPARNRRVEQAWRRSNQETLRSYANQWVVLEGEKIVAHGDDPARLVEQAREKGIAVPYVFYVDPPRPGIAKIGL